MPHSEQEKITVRTVKARKRKGERITAVTSYDYPTTRIVSDAGVDLILVGDSMGMVLHGRGDTLGVTMDEMIYHTKLVSQARPHSLVVADMPFGSYQVSREETVRNALRCIKEGGAEAVKVEGGRKRFEMIDAILNAEIPVLAHLGLTPQSVHALGGFRVQGKLKGKAREILEDAIELEKRGVFAVVLESIPAELATVVTRELKIPTIGIGAGPDCDGQILVFHDLVGFTKLYMPKFVRQYADLYDVIHGALTHYVKDVHEGVFPDDRESYHLKRPVEELLK